MTEMNVVYSLWTDTGKVYIGSSSEITKRLDRHQRELEKGIHHNQKLQDEYDNESSISVELFACDDREHAYAVEEALIDYHYTEGNLLNIGKQSRGGDNLSNNPRKARIVEQIANALRERNRSMSPEERKRKFGRPGILNGMYGRTHTSEVKKTLSETHKGNTYCLGYKHGPEMRRKISILAKKRIGNKNSFYGKNHSEETKRKLSIAKRGRKPTNANKIEIDGVLYESQADAAKALGVSSALITYRLKSSSDKYSGYRVIT